ncbi:MAG: hypothetical protein WA815_07730 [Terracidiphilus sp.]
MRQRSTAQHAQPCAAGGQEAVVSKQKLIAPRGCFADATEPDTPNLYGKPIVGALAGAGPAALTGLLVVRCGYGLIFNINAVPAGFAALLVFACHLPSKV